MQNRHFHHPCWWRARRQVVWVEFFLRPLYFLTSKLWGSAFVVLTEEGVTRKFVLSPVSIIILLGLSGCQTMNVTEKLSSVASESMDLVSRVFEKSLDTDSNADIGTEKVVVEETPVETASIESTQELTDELNQFISEAEPGTATTMSQTPWGDNVGIVLNESYLAASGRKCRVLRVRQRRAITIKAPIGYTPSLRAARHAMKAPFNVLVCEENLGNWVPVRTITRQN